MTFCFVITEFCYKRKLGYNKIFQKFCYIRVFTEKDTRKKENTRETQYSSKCTFQCVRKALTHSLPSMAIAVVASTIHKATTTNNYLLHIFSRSLEYSRTCRFSPYEWHRSKLMLRSGWFNLVKESWVKMSGRKWVNITLNYEVHLVFLYSLLIV